MEIPNSTIIIENLNSPFKTSKTLPEIPLHNLNFPHDYAQEEDPILSFAGFLRLGSLFEKVKGKDYHQLVYKPEWLDEQEPEIGSDLWVLEQGKPSVSRLSFADISGRKHLEP